MPRGDGTGPAGMGPMTGRGAGYCAGFSAPGYVNPAPGRGFGWFGRGGGWGGGRGWRNRRFAAGYGPGMNPAWGYPSATEPSPKEELGMLRHEAELLSQELQSIRDRMQTLEKVDKEEKKTGA